MMVQKLRPMIVPMMLFVLLLIGTNSALAKAKPNPIGNPGAAATSRQHFRLQSGATFAKAGAQAQAGQQAFFLNGSVQPYICIDNGTTNGGTTAFFGQVANRFPFQANLDGPLDQVGLVVNLPAGTPASGVSFEVVPQATTQNLYIAIGGNYISPQGVPGTFRSDNIPNSIFGNPVRNKNLSYNFHIPDLINAVGDVPVPEGSTLTFLLIDVEELFPALQPGRVFLDNVIVNGHPVAQKDLTPVAGCPIPF